MPDKRYLFVDDYEICPACRGSGWDPAFDYSAQKRSCRSCGGNGSSRKAGAARRDRRDGSSGSAPLTHDAAVSAATLRKHSLLGLIDLRVAEWQRAAQRPLPVMQLPSFLARWQPGPAENAQWTRSALRWRDIYAILRATIAGLDPASPNAVDAICGLRGLGEDGDHELAAKLDSLESSCRTIRVFRP